MVNPDLPEAAQYAALGRALRALRDRAGLKQEEAAERIGIRATFISLIENGRRGMRWHTLMALLHAYDATLAELAAQIERDKDHPE